MAYHHPTLYTSFLCGGLVASLLLMLLLTYVFSCGQRLFTLILAIINLMIITCLTSVYVISVFMVTPDRKPLKIAIGVVIIMSCGLMTLHLLLNAIHLMVDVVRVPGEDMHLTQVTTRKARGTCPLSPQVCLLGGWLKA